MKTRKESYDLVVCGGGLAGVCAAIAAARHGAKTCLVQDRPVLGGNSSSEIRVPPHGAAAFHAYARETGIISELLIEERARNHEPIFENGWTNSVWDMVLYDLAVRTPNLVCHLNTQVFAAVMAGAERTLSSLPPEQSRGFLHRAACAQTRKLAAVIGRVANAEVELVLAAKLFVDCTGDSIVADLAGCEWRMGCEGREEFGELHAPPVPDRNTMGSSLHFKAKDMGRPVPFMAPEWAMKYEDAAFFYKGGRDPKDVRGGFWWIEIGVPWDTIHDAEDIRHELTRHTLGVWDWIKNKDPRTKERAANYALDWIGQVPGKRESRRVMGLSLVTENDLQNKVSFPDEIAFGGWFLDLHTPGGLLAPTSEPASAEGYVQTTDFAVNSYLGPYGLPLRALIAKDVDNLLLAGRNISVTRAALGTTRVMGTTALLGQAAGTAAAISLARGLPLSAVPEKAIGEVQQALLRDGCFLPSVANSDPADLARTAQVTASSEALFYGAGPQTRARREGTKVWSDQPQSARSDPLLARRGQWLGIGNNRLDEVSVCLSNTSGREQSVSAWLVPVDHIWDYRCEPGEPLAATTLTVPPGEWQWIEWPAGLSVKPGRYLRLDLGANPGLCWHTAGGIEPAHPSAYEMGKGRMRRYGNGTTMSVRVSPAQACFSPRNVINGVTRPHRFTNLWRSDPAQPLPQWLRLAWDAPQTISQVELTFPGQLFREYHAYPPFHHDPQCARDYCIRAQANGRWEELLRVTGNYQRRRCHRFPRSVSASALDIVVHATNGDPSAAIYEVRCYA